LFIQLAAGNWNFYFCELKGKINWETWNEIQFGVTILEVFNGMWLMNKQNQSTEEN